MYIFFWREFSLKRIRVEHWLRQILYLLQKYFDVSRKKQILELNGKFSASAGIYCLSGPVPAIMTKMERMSRLVLEITDHLLHCAAPRCLWLRLEPNGRLYSHKDDAARTERALRGHKNKRTKPLFQWNSFETLSLHLENVCLVFILFPSAHGLGILKSNLTLIQSLLTEFSNFSQILLIKVKYELLH